MLASSMFWHDVASHVGESWGSVACHTSPVTLPAAYNVSAFNVHTANSHSHQLTAGPFPVMQSDAAEEKLKI